MTSEPYYLGALAHVLRDGRVLLPMSRRRGVWKTVGGMTEPGETPEQTMLREVQEEIGIRPSAFRRLPDRHRGRVRLAGAHRPLRDHAVGR